LDTPSFIRCSVLLQVGTEFCFTHQVDKLSMATNRRHQHSDTRNMSILNITFITN